MARPRRQPLVQRPQAAVQLPPVVVVAARQRPAADAAVPVVAAAQAAAHQPLVGQLMQAHSAAVAAVERAVAHPRRLRLLATRTS